jgi:hypothetical protein
MKIYNKYNVLVYSFIPDMAYFYYKNNYVIIKVEDQENIVLDFETNEIATEALKKLNRIKSSINDNPSACGCYDDPCDGGGGGSSTLLELDDTFINVSALTNDSFLKYDINLSGWTNFDLSVLSASTFTNLSPTPHTVGGIVAGSSFDHKNMSEMWNQLLYPTIMPTLTPKYSTISGVVSTVVEVGTSFTFTLNYGFNQGSIDSKDSHPNIPLVGPEISHSFSGPGLSGNVVSMNATQGTMSWGINVSHSEGTGNYYDSTGTPANNLDSHRYAGSTSSTSSKHAYYYYYVGEGNVTLPTDSASVRSMTKHFRTNSNFSFSYIIPSGNTYFAFFLDGVQKQLLSVIHSESNSEEKDNFIISGPFQIADASGTLKEYYKYEQDIGGIGYTANATYNITIG